MQDSSTTGGGDSSVLGELEGLLEASRPAFRQARVFGRAKALVAAELMNFTRHTLTQDLLSLGLTQADWTAWYRLFSHRRYDADELDRLMLRQTLAHVAPGQPYVIGVDATQVARSSLKMPGTGWTKCPLNPPFRRGIHRAQRFEHCAWLTPLEEGYSRAVPLRFLPLVSPKTVPVRMNPLDPSEAVTQEPEWQVGLGAAKWVRRELEAAGRGEQELVVLGDGVYDTLGWWRQLPAGAIGLVRTKANRKLMALPPLYSGRGRRRKYGQAAKRPKEWLGERAGWSREELMVRGRQIRMRYRVEGPYLRQGAPERVLYLLVVSGASWRRGTTTHRRQPAYYLVSARQAQAGGWGLPYPLVRLLEWLWQRWELEVAHREMKTGLGLGDKQCWHPRSAVYSVRFSAWVYGLAVLAGYRAWGLFGGPKCPGRWWRGARRWSLTTLLRELRAKLWGGSDFTPLWPGMGSNWGKKGGREAAMTNAAAAASRI